VDIRSPKKYKLEKFAKSYNHFVNNLVDQNKISSEVVLVQNSTEIMNSANDILQ